MGQEIYNEGRVVGLSAWEIFAKHAEAAGVPSSVIPNENQWLTAMIGAGASMILRIPAATTAGIHDFDLPLGSNLTSAGVIIANPFMGACDWDNTHTWATKITSYSPLILNNPVDYPTNIDVPQDDTYTTAVYKDTVSEFTKITDGIVFTKNATWVDSKIQEDTFTGDGETVTYALSSKATSLDTVTVDGATPTTTYTLDADANTVTFGVAPSDESEIIITYTSLPDKDIDPNFNESSTAVRLYISSDITKDTAVLLTGFQNKRILQGLSGFADSEGTGGSADITTNDWQNGGMLGPEVIPWASKIIFTVPSSTYKLANSLTRTIPSDEAINNPAYDETEKKLYGYTLKDFNNATVESNSFIDFNSIKLTDYYDKHAEDLGSNTGVIDENVQNISLNTNTLTAWYPGLTSEVINGLEDNAKYFPPALYAAQITESGDNILVPVDVAAPGTVKGFSNSIAAYNYKQLLPNNYSIYYNRDENTYSFVTPNEPNPNNWSGTATLEYIPNAAPQVKVTAGNQFAKFVALTKVVNNEVVDYNISPSAYFYTGSTPITWSQLMYSLANESGLDVMGDKLRALAQEFNSSGDGNGGVMGNNTPGRINSLVTAELALRNSDNTNRSKFTLDRSQNSNVIKADTGTGLKSGTDFIEFSNGLRLYILKSNQTIPTTNVPVGSIGIGW